MDWSEIIADHGFEEGLSDAEDGSNEEISLHNISKEISLFYEEFSRTIGRDLPGKLNDTQLAEIHLESCHSPNDQFSSRYFNYYVLVTNTKLMRRLLNVAHAFIDAQSESQPAMDQRNFLDNKYSWWNGHLEFFLCAYRNMFSDLLYEQEDRLNVLNENTLTKWVLMELRRGDNSSFHQRQNRQTNFALIAHRKTLVKLVKLGKIFPSSANVCSLIATIALEVLHSRLKHFSQRAYITRLVLPEIFSVNTLPTEENIANWTEQLNISNVDGNFRSFAHLLEAVVNSGELAYTAQSRMVENGLLWSAVAHHDRFITWFNEEELNSAREELIFFIFNIIQINRTNACFPPLKERKY